MPYKLSSHVRANALDMIQNALIYGIWQGVAWLGVFLVIASLRRRGNDIAIDYCWMLFGIDSELCRICLFDNKLACMRG